MLFRSRDTRNALLLAALILLLFADVLFLGRGFFQSDLSTYHFPMKKVVRDMTFSGDFPAWNPAYHGGQPLAANPAYELWYPPQWLVYLPSYAYGFQLHILFHLVVAGIGMYAFLRSLELGELAAAFGGLTFAIGGPLLSLTFLLPFLFSTTWIPLVLLFARRLILRPNRRDFALTALFVSLQALIGEPVMLLQSGMLAGAYVLYRYARKRGRRELPRVALIVVVALLAGVLVAAVQLGPAVDHAKDSIRSEGFHWQVASNWSTPPVRFIELLFPRVFRAMVGEDGNAAIRTLYPYRIQPFVTDVYIGLLGIVLALAGILAGVRGRGFVLLVFLGLTILALGEHTPVFRLLYEAKIFASVRYPEKFLLGALLVLIVWASMVLDRLLAGDAKVRTWAIRLTLGWAALAFLFWMAGTRETHPSVAIGAPVPWVVYWFENLARAAVAWAILKFVLGRKPAIVAAALLAFVVADFSFLHFSTAARRPHAFFEEPPIAKTLPADRSSYRVFNQASWDEWESAPESIAYFAERDPEDGQREAMFPDRHAAYGFRGALEDDLDQTALMTSTRYLRAAQNVRRYTRSWNTFFLDSANVEATIEHANATVVSRNTGKHPRYYFATRAVSIADDNDLVRHVLQDDAHAGDAFISGAAVPTAPGTVASVNERPSRVSMTVDATGDALLVAAITAHRYWTATIDGRVAPILPVNIAFQGVRVPPGHHVVELRYRNPLILRYGIVSLLALLAIVVTGVWPRRSELPST